MWLLIRILKTMWLKLYFCWTVCWSRLSTWPFLPTLLMPHWSRENSGALLTLQALFWNGIQQGGIQQGFTRSLSLKGTKASISVAPFSSTFRSLPIRPLFSQKVSKLALQLVFYIVVYTPPELLKTKANHLTLVRLCYSYPEAVCA